MLLVTLKGMFFKVNIGGMEKLLFALWTFVMLVLYLVF